MMLLLAFDEDFFESDMNNAGLFLEIMSWKCFVILVMRFVLVFNCSYGVCHFFWNDTFGVKTE